MNVLKRYTPVLGASVIGGSLLLPLAVRAQATEGAAAVNGLVAGQAGYLPAMLALALAAVGIMIAIKWVKRARGAA